MYIEESFDTIFNMDYGSGKSPMDERVKVKPCIITLGMSIERKVPFQMGTLDMDILIQFFKLWSRLKTAGSGSATLDLSPPSGSCY